MAWICASTPVARSMTTRLLRAHLQMFGQDLSRVDGTFFLEETASGGVGEDLDHARVGWGHRASLGAEQVERADQRLLARPVAGARGLPPAFVMLGASFLVVRLLW